MKREIIFVIGLVWLAGVGPVRAAEEVIPMIVKANNTSEQFSLKVGEKKSIGDFQLRLVKIVADTRCPKDRKCEWAGMAVAQLQKALAYITYLLYNKLGHYES